ncbi:FxSxx-COOH system tetratricopeptide repeat protein [Actinoplanes sp. NPDC051861]|uniref:FxSxx-COOH system tetratricopeptide repeat protein n=1 Tax=Actinoplanes sp. NPDC051861 TaxID=3155170 RepID=UPI0034459ED4
MHRAFIVCNSVYESDPASFDRLLGPRSDGPRLWQALTDPVTGMFRHENVRAIPEGTAGAILEEAERFFSESEPDDVVLFYFSGHGWRSNRQLFLCARNTRVNGLQATGVPDDTLNRMVDACAARSKIIVLDCCYSGAYKGRQAAERFAGQGRFVLAASPPNQLVKDAERDGQLSPFTKALVDGLTGGAQDRDGDGLVDLDDLHAFLVGALAGGPQPFRRWTGSGNVNIARRPVAAQESPPAPETVDVAAPLDPGDDRAFLDRMTAATSYSVERVRAFREDLRDDIPAELTADLPPLQFLHQAHLMSAGRLTLAGALLFGASPAAILPTAIVQCTRIDGADRSAPIRKRVFRGTVPEQIVGARDFVAEAAIRGEAPTEYAAQVRPVFEYPMIAVREIIANALVHRDYQNHESCVHVRVFADRIEVVNPGTWTGSALMTGTRQPLAGLATESRRRNFRLAEVLSWMKLVEGEGAGIPRAIQECRQVGAPEPVVVQEDGLVVVTIYPLRAAHGDATAEQPPSWDEKQRLCDALLEVPGLLDGDSRSLYLAEVSQRLGKPMTVKRHADVRHDLLAIVNTCQAIPGGLRALVEVVKALHGGHPALAEVERLLEESEAALIGADDRLELVQMLRELPPVRTAEAFRRAVEGLRLPDPPPSWQDALAVVRRLESAASRDGAPPPLMVFVEEVAHSSGRADSRHLHEWLDGVAPAVGMDQAAVRALCSSIGGRDLPSTVLASSPEITLPAVAVLPRSVIRGDIPVRNPYFVGRHRSLDEVRSELSSQGKVVILPQALHSLGGVGKTQLAAEYVHRFADNYDLIWWLPAGDPLMVLDSLSRLAERLGISGSEDRRQTAGMVLDNLATSELRWLLVFDNADDPQAVAQLLPSGRGHVIVTSRNPEWHAIAPVVELDVFDRRESVELICRRHPRITEGDAARLAEALGDLPLALEQAVSWQAVTGMPVEEYLELLGYHVRELMSEGRPTAYPSTIAATTGLVFERLRMDMPAAAFLLDLFAFLGDAPISVRLLRLGRSAIVDGPLDRVLRDPMALSRTIRDLRSFGLARIDSDQRIQVPRLVRMFTRDALLPDAVERTRRDVQNLLAAANPGYPEDPATWATHAEIAPHVIPADLLTADSEQAGMLVLDQLRYLLAVGDYEGGRRLGELAAETWRSGTASNRGPAGEHTLLASRHLADALRSLGYREHARALGAEVLEQLRDSPEFGPEHEYTLSAMLGRAADLRLAGDYPGAHELDRRSVEQYREVFGPQDVATLSAMRSLAEDLRLLGDPAAALRVDQELMELWRAVVDENDPRRLSGNTAIARDLYDLGRYQDAVNLQFPTLHSMRERLSIGHIQVLLAARTLAVAMRKAGRYAEALDQSRSNRGDLGARFGPDHEYTLAAEMSHANTLLVAGEMRAAQTLASEVVNRYRDGFGADHPLTLAAMVNSATTLRQVGDVNAARSLDEHAHRMLIDVLGEKHPNTLCAANNVANDLALSSESDVARELSDRTFQASREVRGEDHPYTQLCAVNLSLDLMATGDESKGEILLRQAAEALGRRLGPDHPVTLDAVRGRRAECDIEMP